MKYTIEELALTVPCTQKDIRKLVAKGSISGYLEGTTRYFDVAEAEAVTSYITATGAYQPTDDTGGYDRTCSKCGCEASGFVDVESVFGFSYVKNHNIRRSRTVCRTCHKEYKNSPSTKNAATEMVTTGAAEPTASEILASFAAKVIEMPTAAKAGHRWPLLPATTYDVEGLAFGPIAIDTLAANTAEGATMVPDEDAGFALDTNEAIVIANALKNAEPTWIWGPSGVGKTSGVRQVAAVLNWPLYRVQMSADFSLDDFVGTTEVVFDEEAGCAITEFRDGVLIRAMLNGGILLIDEITGTPPHILLALQAVLERVEDPHTAWAAGKAHCKFVNTANGGEVIHAHPNFRIIVTDNTNGQGDVMGMFAGTNVMNEATRSRFTQWFRKDFPAQATWLKILMAKVPGLHTKKAEAIINVALASNKQSRSLGSKVGACDLVINPRDTLAIARLAMVYDSVTIAFTIGLANSIDPSDPDATYLKDLVKNIVGSH